MAGARHRECALRQRDGVRPAPPVADRECPLKVCLPAEHLDDWHHFPSENNTSPRARTMCKKDEGPCPELGPVSQWSSTCLLPPPSYLYDDVQRIATAPTSEHVRCSPGEM